MYRIGILLAPLISLLVTTDIHGDEAKVKTRKIGEIEWFLDYDDALKVAKEKQRPLWLHFGEHPG